MNTYFSTAEWLNIFKQNSRKVLRIERDSHRLSARELLTITSSIQDFQLGESSEGYTLRRNAAAFAEKYNLPEYTPLMNHFIAEENRHSVYLGQFMKQHNIKRKRQTFNDSVFRWIRKLIGIETSIRTLVTAEIIALTYYQALAAATRSPVLQKICHHMLAEEDAHVHFQMQHIQFINLQKSPVTAWLADAAHHMLVFGALTTVWLHHRQVLRHKYTLRSYFAHAFADFNRVLIKGKAFGAQMLQEWQTEVANAA